MQLKKDTIKFGEKIEPFCENSFLEGKPCTTCKPLVVNIGCTVFKYSYCLPLQNFQFVFLFLFFEGRLASFKTWYSDVECLLTEIFILIHQTLNFFS